jgi:hypothetical protein
MKLKLYVCLAVGALIIGAQASAAPMFDPFLSVDVNGYNAGGGQSIGPTALGYEGWEAAEGLFLDPSIDWGNSGAAGLTKIFGSVTANMRGVAPESFRGARNRGANAGALSDLSSDFVFAQRNVAGFGQHYIKLTLSGLNPGETYEFTGFAREPFNGGVGETDTSFQAWSDREALGGLDGPGAWMDANIGPGALYQPAYASPADPMTDGTYKNPIPTLARGQISGPDSADPFAYSVSFLTTANAGGVVEVYGWADPQGYSGTQTASLLNGFQLAAIPEPASLALFGVSLAGLALRRRH